MDFDDDDDEDQIRSPTYPLSMYISEGNKYFRMHQYEKAIERYTKALEKDPKSTASLSMRSRCYMRIAQHQLAMSDAEQVLSLNPKSSVAACLKAEAEYLIGDFERGLVTYSRGHQVQPTFKPLKHGQKLTSKAIENALGRDARMVLGQDDVEKMNKLVAPTKGGIVNRPQAVDKSRDSYSRGVKKIVPDLFTGDVKYLRGLIDDLVKEQDLERSVQDESQSILPTCEELLAFLEDRQEFWQMQKPVHARKKVARQRRTSFDSKNFALRAKERGKVSRIALEKGEIDGCLESADQMLKLVEDIPDEYLPQKMRLKGYAYDMMGRAYMKKEDLDTSLQYLKQEYNISVEHNLLKLRARALCHMGENYMMRGFYESAIKCFKENILLLDTDAAKVTVLYHVARCQLKMGDITDAKATARTALSLVTFTGDVTRQIDFNLLLADIEYDEKNLEAAAEKYQNALTLARRSKDYRKESIKQVLREVSFAFENELETVKEVVDQDAVESIQKPEPDTKAGEQDTDSKPDRKQIGSKVEELLSGAEPFEFKQNADENADELYIETIPEEQDASDKGKEQYADENFEEQDKDTGANEQDTVGETDESYIETIPVEEDTIDEADKSYIDPIPDIQDVHEDTEVDKQDTVDEADKSYIETIPVEEDTVGEDRKSYIKTIPDSQDTDGEGQELYTNENFEEQNKDTEASEQDTTYETDQQVTTDEADQQDTSGEVDQQDADKSKDLNTDSRTDDQGKDTTADEQDTGTKPEENN